MFHFMNFVRPFVNYAIFRELCDRMRFEVNCAKSHHRVISEGLNCEPCEPPSYLNLTVLTRVLRHKCETRMTSMARWQLFVTTPTASSL